MISTFNNAAEIHSSLNALHPEVIKQKCHIGNDLELNSIEKIDAIFEIDKSFDIQSPYGKWVEELNQGGAPTEKNFVLKNLSEQIDQIAVAKAT